MQLDWFTFGAQIINFLILLWLLQRFLYKPVQQVMQKREKEITGKLEEARLTLVDARTKLSEYQQKLDQLIENEKAMIAESRQEAEEYRKNLLMEARYEIEKIQNRWRRTIDEEKEQFLTELEERSFEKLLDAVQKIIGELAGQGLEHHVLTNFIHKIEQISQEQIKTFTESSDHKLDITTAFPLKEKDRHKIEAILRQVFVDDIECQFEDKPELGLGIEIRTSGWKMGWNLRSYLEEMKADLSSFLETKGMEETQNITGEETA
ncbi:MAG: F0F1 ATP synthase subunit delta [Gracilimonas sp.]|uniref:F0F1 ATP synthase subunit delta n=1 Tax=Gracilimonas sp. TaxID=1974203 RepID=UPI0019C93919|nr:F0F1 ATP synthase subunit delta [Gracilimonas sp.]MBD3616306.1 F0F1 ATP synthase subunit delta [Gracilimonas sp.]